MKYAIPIATQIEEAARNFKSSLSTLDAKFLTLPSAHQPKGRTAGALLKSAARHRFEVTDWRSLNAKIKSAKAPTIDSQRAMRHLLRDLKKDLNDLEAVADHIAHGAQLPGALDGSIKAAAITARRAALSNHINGDDLAAEIKRDVLYGHEAIERGQEDYDRISSALRVASAKNLSKACAIYEVSSALSETDRRRFSKMKKTADIHVKTRTQLHREKYGSAR